MGYFNDVRSVMSGVDCGVLDCVMIKGKKGFYVDFIIMWFLDRNEIFYFDFFIVVDFL